MVSGTMVGRWMLLLSGCCRQVGIVVSRVVWHIGGCYCKVVSLGRYV